MNFGYLLEIFHHLITSLVVSLHACAGRDCRAPQEGESIDIDVGM